MRYKVDRGGQARTVKGMEARKKINRLMHGEVLTIRVQDAPEHERHFLYDCRRQRRHIYGAVLAYIDTALAQGRSAKELQQIPQWIAAYIDEQGGTSTPVEIKLVA